MLPQRSRSFDRRLFRSRFASLLALAFCAFGAIQPAVGQASGEEQSHVTLALSDSRLALRIDPFVELYFTVRAEAARLDAPPLPGHETVVEATRRVQASLGAWGGWGPLDSVVLATRDAVAVRESFSALPEPMRKEGRDVSVRADAVALARALEALLPHFTETAWPERQRTLETAIERLGESLLPVQRDALAYTLHSLGMADPAIEMPVFLVTACHPPGASTYFLGPGEPATVLGLAGLEAPGLLEETTLHESTHGLDIAARGGMSAFQTLREMLAERGVGRDDRHFHDIPHTLMFVQSEETIRRLVAPQHVAYGDFTDLYQRMGETAVVERRIWKRYLGGELGREQALRQIVDELVPVPSRAASSASPMAGSPPTGSVGDGARPEVASCFAGNVTARRRQEASLAIPIAVSSCADEAIRELSMGDLSVLGDFVPNLDFAVSGGFGDQASDADVRIRGVGQLGTSMLVEPAVGIYVDEVPLGTAQGANLDLLDLSRVEVLRGPQVTLYGIYGSGGVINLVTKPPSRERTGTLEGTLGEFDRRELRGAVSGAVSDRVSVSLALMSANRDGFSRSLESGQRLNDANRDSGRLSLLVAPNQNLNLRLSVDASRQREAGSNLVLLSFESRPIQDFYSTALRLAGQGGSLAEHVSDSLLRSSAGTLGSYERDTFGSSVVVGWTASPNLEIRSTTSWRQLDFATTADLDGTPDAITTRSTNDSFERLGQEIVFSGQARDRRLTWLAGADWAKARPRTSAVTPRLGDLFGALEALPGPILAPPGVPGFLCDPGPPPPGLPCFGGIGNPLNRAFSSSASPTTVAAEFETRGAFAEGSLLLGERATATLGLRYANDRKTYEAVQDDTTLLESSAADSWDQLTPRLTLSFRTAHGSLWYLTAAQGFRSGGFDVTSAEGLVRFDSEKLWSYELGFKRDLADRDLLLSGSVFWIDYDDILLPAITAGSLAIRNAGSAEIKGFELEALAGSAQGVQLSAAVGYADSELLGVDPGVTPGISEVSGERRLPRTPEWTLTAGLRYVVELEGGGALVARADYSYRSELANDLANTPAISQDPYGLINARVAFVPPSERWELALFATNLGDEEYLEHAVADEAFGLYLGQAGRPREWGVSVRWRFRNGS